MGARFSKKENNYMPRPDPYRNVYGSSKVQSERVCQVTPNFLIKAAVGEVSIGKTTLIVRLAEGQFVSEPENFISKQKSIDKLGLTIIFVDTEGVERYHAMTSSIYRGANVVLLCFDITDEASFRACREGYLADVRRYAPRTVKVALVGCRKDLATGERQRVSTDAIRQFAAANSFPYFETSALTGEGTSELLDWLIEQAHPGRAVQAHQVSESAERKQRSGSAISRMKESLSGTNRNSAAASS